MFFFLSGKRLSYRFNSLNQPENVKDKQTNVRWRGWARLHCLIVNLRSCLFNVKFVLRSSAMFALYLIRCRWQLDSFTTLELLSLPGPFVLSFIVYMLHKFIHDNLFCLSLSLSLSLFWHPFCSILYSCRPSVCLIFSSALSFYIGLSVALSRPPPPSSSYFTPLALFFDA